MIIAMKLVEFIQGDYCSFGKESISENLAVTLL